MNVPDWLWQGLVEETISNAIWAGIVVSAAWAWKKSRRKPVLLSGSIHGTGMLSGSIHAKSTGRVASSAQGTLTVVDTRKAPTPSLARRLEDLAAWYLHVS